MATRSLGILLGAALVSTGCGRSDGVTGPSTVVEPTAQPVFTRPEIWIVWGQSNALGCAEGPGNAGAAGVEAWSPVGWAPAEQPLPFMDPLPGCESGWAVAAANAMGRAIRLTGHARGAKAISYWLTDPSPLLRNLVDAKDARWMIAYQGESDALRRSTTWATAFAQLAALVRRATNPELRVLVIGLADEPSTVGRNLWNNLREQQLASVASLCRACSARRGNRPLIHPGTPRRVQGNS